jgi:hypothetical protein
MDIPNTFNSMIYATLQPTQSINLEQNLSVLTTRKFPHALLTDSMKLTLDNLQPAPQRTVVFTDDKSPIEWITNTMILNFILQGEIGTMQ